MASTGGDLQVVAPTLGDPLIHDDCDAIGGPIGEHASGGSGWWTPIRVLVILALVGFLVGLLAKVPCGSSGWADPGRYTHMCYSDIPPLFSLRGFADGILPYVQNPLAGQEQLEYPVLTGIFMVIAGLLTPKGGASAALWFFSINAVMLAVCLLVTVVATAATVRRRPWDAAMVALAPGTILCATINWDLLAVALTAVSLALWARKYPTSAGIVLGLAAAAKFYPFMLLGPLLILCWRASQLRAFCLCLLGTVGAWLVVNVPFMVINFTGWSHFYTFSSARGEDFGSPWLVLTKAGAGVPADSLNGLAAALFLLLCAAIAVFGLKAPRRPRLAPMCFLVIAAFLVTNKVYSPQYVLWLIPLAALARPRWRDFLIWQAGEVIYFAAIWWYLAGLNGGKGLPEGWYAIAIIIHIAATGYFSALLVRDALQPQFDPIRTDGWPEDCDDPGGGVLDQAPDREPRSRKRSSAMVAGS